MNRLGLVVTFCVSHLSSAWSSAAPEEATKPAPPFVLAVPTAADWTMKLKAAQASQPGASESSSASAAAVITLHFTKVGDIQRVILTLSNGQTQEYYKLQDFHIIPTTVPGRYFVSPHVPTAPPYPYYSTGFFGVDWVKAETFAGIDSRAGTKCFYYKQSRPNPMAGAPNLPPEALAESKKDLIDEAWIDFNTKLPVAVSINGEILEYAFGTPPDSLNLPPAQKSAWAAWQEQIARLEAMKVR